MCYIICTTIPSFYVAMSMWGGQMGEGYPLCKDSREIPLDFFFFHFLHLVFVVFQNMVFTDGFLISVKELGLLINLGQWIRGFGCRGILYILYCKQ
jgi:hypothetical protein